MDKAAHYDTQYCKQNYFGYSQWIFTRYVANLIRTAGLKKGSLVLDVGCGQGLFSYLFWKYGMDVHGIDISEVGINSARELYGAPGIKFSVADIENAGFAHQFDCVFVRSCSLYNTSTFPNDSAVTARLMGLVRPGGMLIFLYNSNLSGKPNVSWRYHSWHDLVQHFSRYKNARMWFSTKIDTCILGRYALTMCVSKTNILLSKVLGIGGDLVCILEKNQ